jgi:hypothetical protein
VAAQLQQPVTVRRVVAVEAPDAALGGRAAEPGRTQPADDGPVDRLAVALGRFGGVHHELVPQREAGLIGAGPGLGGQQPSLPLADADAFEGERRARQQRAEFGQHAADSFRGADGDDHHRDLGVPDEERGPFAAAVRGAVHAEQRGGAVDAAAVQQVADRHEGRDPAGPFLAAQVDGQLGRLVPLSGGPAGVGDVGQQPGPLQVTSPVRLSSTVFSAAYGSVPLMVSAVR